MTSMFIMRLPHVDIVYTRNRSVNRTYSLVPRPLLTHVLVSNMVYSDTFM